MAPDVRLLWMNRDGLLRETGYGDRARPRKNMLSEREGHRCWPAVLTTSGTPGCLFLAESGVDAMESARRAGHSIAVLHRVWSEPE
jgi:hypothetical protein